MLYTRCCRCWRLAREDAATCKQSKLNSVFVFFLKRPCHDDIIAVLGQFCAKVVTQCLNHFARWGIKSIMDEKHANPKNPFSTFFPDLLCIQNQNDRNNKKSYKRKTSHKIHCTLYINTVLHI